MHHVDEILNPKKLRRKRAIWAAIDRLGHTLLNNAPLMQQNKPIADGKGLLLVVGHIERRDADMLQNAAHLIQQAVAQSAVERAKRFIQHEQAWLRRQAPRQRHALLFAAAQLQHIALFIPFQPHQRQHFRHATANALAGPTLHTQAKRHIFSHGAVWKKSVLLKHQAKAACMRWYRINTLTGKPNRPAIRVFQTGDAAQQRAFSAPTRSQQGHNRPLSRAESYIAQNRLVIKRLVYVFHKQQ